MNRSQMNRGGSRGAQQTGAVANMDADLGDEEGVTVSEYNRWLIQEDNWNSAEETRSAYMEGSQFRKTRDEKHREKGMERQAASIEQMKLAKGRVEEHREHNLEQGKVSAAPLVLSSGVHPYSPCHDRLSAPFCVHFIVLHVRDLRLTLRMCVADGARRRERLEAASP